MNQLSRQECFQQLNNLLQRQTAELDSINAYFIDIKTVITEGDTEKLNRLLTQQRLPIAEMEDLESQRNKLLKLYGFETDKEGLLACIHSCDQKDILNQHYQLFEQALSKLQRSIQLNSLLVNKSQKRVRQSLHLLSGQPATDDARTYSSSGLTQDLSKGREIAQA